MRTSRRSAGFSLLEVVIALVVLSIIVILCATSFTESTDAGRVITADAELRAKAQSVLEQIAKDLRSTRSSSVDISQMSSTPRKLCFYPITGTTASSPYYTVANTSTTYSWNPTLTTGTGSWQLSTLLLTPYDKPSLQVAIAREVTDFSVTALGTTATSGFSNTTTQAFEIRLELSRRKVMEGTAANPQGKISVAVTTRVQVTGG